MKMRTNITIIFGDDSTSRIVWKIKQHESRTSNNYQTGHHTYKKVHFAYSLCWWTIIFRIFVCPNLLLCGCLCAKYMMTKRISKIAHNQIVDDYQIETNEEKNVNALLCWYFTKNTFHDVSNDLDLSL
jgi:hypothetical protein